MPAKKVLIIDDEPDVITYLTALLESNGYEASSTNNTKSAMEKVKTINPDLICLDIMMPYETGISFYTKLRQDKDVHNIPVIIISGVVESEKFNFHSYVSDDSILPPEFFMEKPINVNKLIKKIEQLVH